MVRGQLNRREDLLVVTLPLILKLLLVAVVVEPMQLVDQREIEMQTPVVRVVVVQMMVQEEVHHPQLKEMRVQMLQDPIKIVLYLEVVADSVAQVVVVLRDLVLVDMVDWVFNFQQHSSLI